MRKAIIVCYLLLRSISSFAQLDFQSVYSVNPLVPEGLLEAVAWTNTRMVNLTNAESSCSGIPQPYGIMGLHANGKNYFFENGKKVATLSEN